MTLEELHGALARAGLGPTASEDDGLAVLLVLHTHRLELVGVALSDRPGVRDLEALTQRHAAEVVAAAWPDRRDVTRTRPQHWYFEFNTRTPFEVAEDVEPAWAERLALARERMLGSGLVRAIAPE